MKINFSTIGQDLLKFLAVVSIVAVEAEPIVDMTAPDVAQVYNLSANTAVQAVQAYVQGSAAAQSPAPVPAAPTPAIARQMQSEGKTAAPDARVEPGPGLSKVVPA